MKSVAALKFGDEKSIEIRDKAEAKGDPLDMMHASFGVKRGKLCGACRHFKLKRYDDAKCEIFQLYGDMRGAWQGNWEACGKHRR